MKLKLIQDETFQDYAFAISMLIACEKCDYKCATDGGFSPAICQNSHLAQMPTINLTNEQIYERYKSNPITRAVVLGGMEPFLQFEEIFDLIKYFRLQNNTDPYIIYTGYYPEEISDKISALKEFENIIIKFGRFIPNQKPYYDETLGVMLASNNQWSEKIS
jgi:hypothetical protein